eukprot:4431056-Amphidinium_carterae.1
MSGMMSSEQLRRLTTCVGSACFLAELKPKPTSDIPTVRICRLSHVLTDQTIASKHASRV